MIKKDKILSPRHEKFVKALASGMDRADAYIEAYPNSRKSKRERVARTAYQLLQRPEVMEAYQCELAKHRAEEDERNRWTYERSVEVRLNAIKSIEEERERRRNAQEMLAKAMLQNPPAHLSSEEAKIEAQRILMMPVLTTQTTTALSQLCDSLDKLTGLNRDGASSDDVIILGDNDVDE